MNGTYLEQHIQRLQSRKRRVERIQKIVVLLSGVTLALLIAWAFASGELTSSVEGSTWTLLLLAICILISISGLWNSFLKATIESLQAIQRTIAEDTHVEG